MRNLIINEHFVFNKQTNTFQISEKYAQFDTAYKLTNPKTGKSCEFEFAHSTGPEFDPQTKWVYKSKEGIILEVLNDEQMTKIAAKRYLDHKLSRDREPEMELLFEINKNTSTKLRDLKEGDFYSKKESSTSPPASWTDNFKILKIEGSKVFGVKLNTTDFYEYTLEDLA